MLLNMPSKLLTLTLSAGLLLSCASQTQPSPPSYTAILAQEVAKQKASDCLLFKPEIIPEDAPLAWREHAEKFGVKWRDYCAA